MNTPERFTLAEAAKNLGISVPTARRMVFKGQLSAVKVMVGEKIRWEIERDEVFTLQARSLQPSPEGFTPEALTELAKLDNSVHMNASLKASEVEAFRDPLKLASVNTSEVEAFTNPVKLASVNASEGAVPLAAHLAILELASKQIDRLSDKADRLQLKAEQAERMRFALEHQLLQYQAALSSQAESLSEERALRMTLEAQKVSKVESSTEIESLKIDMPTGSKSWGTRVKRWLGIRTGT